MIPNLTEEQIINYCGPFMYEKGVTLLVNNPFNVYFQYLGSLVAIELNFDRCANVAIFFNDEKIINSYCSCIDNQWGPCKHIAALLIMWKYNRYNFLDKPQWIELLYTKEKKELVKIIKKMVDCTINFNIFKY